MQPTTIRTPTVAGSVLIVLLGIVCARANDQGDLPRSVAQIVVEADKPIGRIGNLYNVGYDGWKDITNPAMVEQFHDLGIKFCRMDVNLKELCGEKPRDYRWDYATSRDVGLGFTDRIRRIIANGWTPLLSLTDNAAETLPKWFKRDSAKSSWTHYNLDGTKVPHGYGDQLDALTQIARDLVAHLGSQGFHGLWWETIYELDGMEPLVEIYHAAAKGIRQADRSAKVVGPATWPGWSVEERFVKPFFRKYGTDLVDAVSMHWYASCDHGFWKLREGLVGGKTIMTMADKDLMNYLMGETGAYGEAVRSMSKLLADKALNRGGKKIGILFSEIDVNAYSYYLRNPENPDWPAYRADTDCWQNCNYFGGVWWTSVLCHIASTGTGADAFKFNTRNYYGVQEGVEPGRAYRYPVWFAMKLLQDAGGVSVGRQMLRTSSTKTGSSLLEAFASGTPQDIRVILVNKSFDSQTADVTVRGARSKSWEEDRYLFDQTQVAHFLGRKPGDKHDGVFQGFPNDDSISQRCLQPVQTSRHDAGDGQVVVRAVSCPPISVVILRLQAKASAGVRNR